MAKTWPDNKPNGFGNANKTISSVSTCYCDTKPTRHYIFH
jgi:hypothetical protein